MPAVAAALEPGALTPREVAELAAVPRSAVERAIARRVVKAWKARGGARRRTAERHLAPEAVVFFSMLEGYKAVLRSTDAGKRTLLASITSRPLADLGAGKVRVADGLEADMARFRPVVDRTLRYMRARNEHIVSDPEVMGGTPVIAGTRVTVYSVLGRVAHGDTVDDILEDNPDLSREAVEAAVIYARSHPPVGRPGGRPFRKLPG